MASSAMQAIEPDRSMIQSTVSGFMADLPMGTISVSETVPAAMALLR